MTQNFSHTVAFSALSRPASKEARTENIILLVSIKMVCAVPFVLQYLLLSG